MRINKVKFWYHQDKKINHKMERTLKIIFSFDKNSLKKEMILMSHPTKLISITLQHFKKRVKLFNKKIKVQLKKISSIH